MLGPTLADKRLFDLGVLGMSSQKHMDPKAESPGLGSSAHLWNAAWEPWQGQPQGRNPLCSRCCSPCAELQLARGVGFGFGGFFLFLLSCKRYQIKSNNQSF